MRLQVAIAVLVLTGIFSCKDDAILGENPYAGGKEPFGIQFDSALPSPEQASTGDLVTYKISGLAKWKDNIQFFINEQSATVVNLTDSTVQIRVPEQVSTGGASVLVDGQTFYGPVLRINGKVRVDPNTDFKPGFDGSQVQAGDIGRFNVLPFIASHLKVSNSYYFVGNFGNYNNNATTAAPITSIVRTNATGVFDKTFALEGKGFGFAVINTITRTNTGHLLVSGNISEYNKRSFIHNITRLESNGSLQKEIIKVINPTPEDASKNSDTIPVFNGNVVGGTITKHFLQDVDGEERIVAVGTFMQYFKYRYDYRPTYEFKNREVTNIKYLLRMRPDGTLDSTFNFNAALGAGKAGPNGTISDGVMYNNKLYLIGDFTAHNGVSVGRIMRLKADGDVDPTFNTGTGANGNILSISIRDGKILVTGAFTTFNGQPHSGVVMLDLDGNIDESFKFRPFTGGIPTYAVKLTNGKILVTGNFTKYDDVQRGGFLLLESDGSAAQAYNTVGGISGRVFDIIEGTSSLGRYQLTLLGSIYKFGSTQLKGIVTLEVE